VTLNGTVALILRYLPEFGGFGADCVKVFEDRLIIRRQKYSPKNLVLSNAWLMAIFADTSENDCINDRHCQRRPKLKHPAARFFCESWDTCLPKDAKCNIRSLIRNVHCTTY